MCLRTAPVSVTNLSCLKWIKIFRKGYHNGRIQRRIFNYSSCSPLTRWLLVQSWLLIFLVTCTEYMNWTLPANTCIAAKLNRSDQQCRTHFCTLRSPLTSGRWENGPRSRESLAGSCPSRTVFHSSSKFSGTMHPLYFTSAAWQT